MAHAVNLSAQSRNFDRTAGLFARIRAAIAAYRQYRATIEELEQLSDRDLSDLGLRRDAIKRIAGESVWGA